MKEGWKIRGNEYIGRKVRRIYSGKSEADGRIMAYLPANPKEGDPEFWFMVHDDLDGDGIPSRCDLDDDGEPISNYTFRLQSRGGQGVIAHQTTSKTGALVALKSVLPDDQLMIATEAGIMIRMAVDAISEYGRNTQGVRVINLKNNDAIADVARGVIEDEEAPLSPAPDGETPAEAVPSQRACWPP